MTKPTSGETPRLSPQRSMMEGPLTPKDLPTTPEEVQRVIVTLREAAENAASDAEMRAIISRIAQISRLFRIKHGIGVPPDPASQAHELDSRFVMRDHLTYLSDRVATAVRQVERGHSQHIAVSMPPRGGKSTLVSLYSPIWLLRRHPEWKIVTASYDGTLTGAWARGTRRIIEENPRLGIALSPDSGAGTRWETVEGGGLYSTSVRGALTGRGARVLIIDDPVRDFVEAHSQVIRQNLWDWWLSVAQTRLEPPYLVMVVMTRWHEDDFVGRLLSTDHEGDPRDWEKISLPALAEADGDVLGRTDGEPLLSPILSETPEEATARWAGVRRTVGTYVFSAMYQQRPSPARGSIFDAGWWRFWTTTPTRATEDGRVVYIDPEEFATARWLDSWDCSFKSTHPDTGGWVVGQRWVRSGANRYLIAQERGRWSFTQTIKKMETWEGDDPTTSPYGRFVHERLIEDRANGPAIIDVLKEKIAGIKPINPTVSKEARARAVTPEIESGNVFLPHPGDPGMEWVNDLLSELRNFPNDAYDDQVDSLTQALSGLRFVGKGKATVPGAAATRSRTAWQQPRDVARAALSDLSRRRV